MTESECTENPSSAVARRRESRPIVPPSKDSHPKANYNLWIMTLLRFLMFLSLIVWVGGIAFLSFVEAPTAFLVLPSRPMAGTVVGHSLHLLHWIGLFSGVAFLGCSMLLYSLNTGSAQPLAARHMLVLAMLLLTAASQFGVSPRMAALRARFGDIETVPATDPGRMRFDALHAWSVRLEGGVLLLGLVAAYLTARPLP